MAVDDAVDDMVIAGISTGRPIGVPDRNVLAALRWTEGVRNVFVLAAEGGVLIGMLLLDGCRIILDVEEEGTVSIESLEAIRSRN